MRRTSRSVKRNSKQISKRVSNRRTRKQYGRGIDFLKLNLVSKNRKRASELASISSKKAQELKELIESV